MIDTFQAVLGIGGLLLSAARVGQLRGDLTARSLWVAIAGLSCAKCLEVWEVYRIPEGLFGTGAGQVAMAIFVGIGATATRLFAYTLRPDRPVRLARVLLPLVAAVATEAAAVIISHPTTRDPALAGKAIYYDDSLGSAVLWAVSLAYLTWALVVVFTALVRWARDVDAGHVRAGLILGAVGVGVGFVFVAEKALMAALWMLGYGPATVAFDEVAEAVVLSVCLALIAAGSSYGAITKQLSRLHGWIWARSSDAALAPLNRQLSEWAPDARVAFLAPTGSRLRLTVTVMAIRDREHHLRQFAAGDLGEHVYQQAIEAGRPDAAARAIAEAVCLSAGARAKARGAAPQSTRWSTPAGGDDLENEVRSLKAVAHALKTDPLVGTLTANVSPYGQSRPDHVDHDGASRP